MEISFSVERILLIVAIIAITLFVYKSCDYKQKYDERVQLGQALDDSLTSYKNKEGELVGRIATLRSQNIKAFLQIHSKDSTVNSLKSLVGKYKKQLKKGGSAGVVTIQGETKIITKTVVDSVKGSYSSKFNLNGWIWGSVSMDADSTKLSIKAKEKVEFIIGKERTGFLGLGKGKYFSDVKLSNPYNVVQDFRTYEVDIPTYKWSLTAGVVGMYDVNTGNILIGPGVTLGYKLFEW